jgi:Big-like domain-containing protein
MNRHSGTRHSGRRTSQRRGAALACVIGVAAQACVGVSPAQASLTGPGVGAGRNITVFHNLDFVGVFGYGPVGDPITVDVIRGGVKIGTTTGPSVDTAEGPGLEVNHGPLGTAQPGDCWTGTTPDIRPGDRIVVTSGGVQDEVTVDNIRYTGQPSLDPSTGDITVAGIAQRADGTPIPASFLDAGEFRDPSGNYRINPDVVEPTAGVTGGFTMRYRPPYTGFRNRSSLTEDRRRQALLGDGHAIGFGHTAPLPAESMLVDGIADVPGPALGCEAAPAANNTTTPVPPPSPPASADTTAPRVTSQTPTGSGAKQVNRDANVTATFSEPITGLSTTSMTLKNDKGVPSAATVTYNPTTRVATLDPTTTLVKRARYTATLTNTITDTAGNRLTAQSWTFTTGG